MTETPRTPAELRSMFGANLKQLASAFPSVSELCRQLGINRTQFNRYLSGESFPRPDVLERICRFFQVDARILLEPLDGIETFRNHPAAQALDGFLTNQSHAILQPGFYQSTESIPDDPSVTSHRLMLIRKIGHSTLLRAYEPRRLSPQATVQQREVQGIVSSNGTNVFALMSRRDAQDSRMMVLSADAEAIEWTGYVVNLGGAQPAQPKPNHLVVRRLEDDARATLPLARAAPFAPQ